MHALGVAFQCELLLHAAEGIPMGINTVHKPLVTQGNDFLNYVICPKCNSVHSYEDCISRRRYGSSTSKLCQHVVYPNHPQLSRRTPCNTLLLKKVRTKHGISLQPFKVYPYRSTKSSLSYLA